MATNTITLTTLGSAGVEVDVTYTSTRDEADRLTERLHDRLWPEEQ